MSEASNAVTDFAFNKLGMDKLIFKNAIGNMASRKIKEKAGCTFLGTGPAKYYNPDLNEEEIWELKKENWKGSF
jgi:ribosomal-protein-alanine N-acetyltransferase